MNDTKTFAIQILEKEKEKEGEIDPHFDLLWDFFPWKNHHNSKATLFSTHK